MNASRDLVFEIGVEEIPSAQLYAATSQLASLAESALRDARLGYAEIRVMGAPRRLVLMVDGLAERQDDHMRAVGEYLEANTSLQSVGGIVMQFLKPQYDEARSAALRGYAHGATVCDAIAERATHTREAYVAA